jgi:hypothetical protein
MADRCLAKTIDVVGGRRGVAPLDDFSAAGPHCIVADDAINHVPILTLLKDVSRHGKGKRINVVALLRRCSRQCPQNATIPSAD